MGGQPLPAAPGRSSSRLVFRGAPATPDDDLDPVPGGIPCRLAQSAQEVWIEIGHGRPAAIEDRQAVTDGSGRLATCGQEGQRQRRADPFDADDADERCTDQPHRRETGRSRAAGCCWGRLGGGHVPNSRPRRVAGTYAIFDMPTICSGSANPGVSVAAATTPPFSRRAILAVNFSPRSHDFEPAPAFTCSGSFFHVSKWMSFSRSTSRPAVPGAAASSIDNHPGSVRIRNHD